MRKKPIVYFDNCALERLIDEGRSSKVLRQRAAMQVLFGVASRGELVMATSSYQLEEVESARLKAPVAVLESLEKWLAIAELPLDSADALDVADALRQEHPVTPWRLRIGDSFHVATAVLRQANYFVTVDDRLLRWANARTRDTILGRLLVVSPQQMVGNIRDASHGKKEEE